MPREYQKLLEQELFCAHAIIIILVIACIFLWLT